MSNRLSLALSGSGLVLALSLAAACTEPVPVEPPPPPMADAGPIELYGGPETGPHARLADCPTDPYPLPPPPHCVDGSAGPGMYAERPDPLGDVYAQAEPAPAMDERRPGWGTMAPVPSPGDPAYGRWGGAYAERAPEPAPEPSPAPGIYAQRLPDAAPMREDAPYAEGVPAYANPPMVVTMEPVPNPQYARRSGARSQEARAAADEALAGAPTRARTVRARTTEARPARAEAPARRPAAATPARPAATAPARQAAAPAKSTERPAAAKAQANARPAAAPAASAPRPTGAEAVREALTNLVRRDATFTAPRTITPGQTETVTLTMPAGLAQTLTDEAKRAGMARKASEARIRATLTGDGWRIVPGEPQTESIRPGQATTFGWQATPERGARPLRVGVAAELAGGRGPVETLDLGERVQELEPGGAAGAGGGLSARAIAAAVLLLLALLGVFYFLRRRDDDDGVIGGGRRGGRRRRPEPVHLTPYAPGADPAGSRDTSPA
jgi:hypothetical protein